MEKKIKWSLLALFVLLGVLWPQGQAKAAGGQVRALMITRGDYSGQSANDLSPAPENDGENFRRVLEHAYGDRLVLADQRKKEGVTTPAGVQSAIAETFRNSGSEDINYFFYSGHGTAYGLALGSGSISAQQLVDAFASCSGHNVLVIDCCYSGQMISKSIRSEGKDFADCFIDDLKRALENQDRTARSALNTPQFQVIAASSKEELSWQGNGVGLFTSSIAMGCGIDAMKAEEKTDWKLGAALADLDQDGSITFDEIYRYVSNVNEMSHVRMYPESNDEEFVPVSGGEIPDLTFFKSELLYDESYQATLRITYSAKSSVQVSMAYYMGDDWTLSWLLQDIPGNGTFHLYDGNTPDLRGTKNVTLPAGNQAVFETVLPFGKEEINAGDHALMFRSTSLPCKYILPFSIAKTVNDSLSENFRLILGAATFLSEDGRELEISADFGTTRTEDTPKPMVSCYIYDAVTGEKIRTLGENEWMQVVGSSFNNAGVMQKGNCYRKFYWDGKNDAGQYVHSGGYLVQVKATGAVEGTREETITVENPRSQLSVSESLLVSDKSRATQIQYYLGSDEEDVSIRVLDTQNRLVKIWNLGDCVKGTESFVTWDGTDESNEMAENGLYTVTLTAKSLEVRLENTVRITAPARITGATLSQNTLSLPLKSGGAGVTVQFFTNYSGTVTVQVMAGQGEQAEVIGTLAERQRMGEGENRLNWNGTMDNGLLAPSGEYFIRISLKADNGLESPAAVTESLTVRTEEPRAEKDADSKSSPELVYPSSVAVKIGNRRVKKVTLGKKENVQLTAVVSPAGTQDRGVTYKSGNRKILSVTSKGKVTAKRVGKAKVTVTTKNGRRAVVTFLVKKAPPQVKIQARKKILKKGRTYQLRAKLPSGTASYKRVYTSSKRKIVSVDANGRIKALRRGKSVVTLKTYNGKKARLTITVK